MKVTVDNVLDKLREYGIFLYNDYDTEDNAHCFMTEGMIIFLDHDDDSISVTFKADCRPEDVASNTLMLCEIDDVTDISIMESFMYDKDNNFISGQVAHDIVKNTWIMSAFKKAAEQNAYQHILENMECFNC